MSIQKLKNRIKKIKVEVCGFGSIIPEDEQCLVVTAKTREEADEIFETLKDNLREKYGDFPNEDLQYVWCKSYLSAD